nr:hypothetical protein [Acinetobacter bereziniae]
MKFHQHIIQAAIFDMDGTLLDTERLRFKALQQASLDIMQLEFSLDYLGCVDTFRLKNSEVVKLNRQTQFYYSLCLVPC